jgi:hypothetical protein
MNINDLTIGYAKELAQMVGQAPQVGAGGRSHPFIGKYCLIRTYSAGVHAGELVSQEGDLVHLKNARRLWSWTANDGIALSGVAIHGYKQGKIDTLVPEIYLTGAIETIPCSVNAQESIKNA